MTPVRKKQKKDLLPPFSSPSYPSIMKVNQVMKYLKDENKPFHILEDALDKSRKQRSSIKIGKAVCHLFTRDFRVGDNAGLSKASSLSQSKNVPLITCYVHCKEEKKKHSISAIQTNYQIKSLEKLRKKLWEKSIPLVAIVVEKCDDISETLLKFFEENQISHIYSNIEYEVDELRAHKDLLDILLKDDISYEPCHNSCIVKPGELKSKSTGNQYSVFSPFCKAWWAYLNSKKDPFFTYPEPLSNGQNFRGLREDLFSSNLPALERTSSSHENALGSMPIGEDEANEALATYVESGKIKDYKEGRNNLDIDVNSHMSVHISNGTVSARTIIKVLHDKGLIKKVDSGNDGAVEYVRQIAWRDFYKSVLCNWPHICMFKPFQLDYDDVKWEYNSTDFQSWCEGKTGYPIVDAAMRELIETAYMHNRSRMIVASFLSKNLLIDWRYGERFFAENLVDYDFASNNGGWGFSSSVGVDPQPYFRIFNAWRQSERFCKKGTYIRKWVPELKDIDDDRAIHNPYNSEYADIARNNGYPRPIVNHHDTRERALERYRQAR